MSGRFGVEEKFGYFANKTCVQVINTGENQQWANDRSLGNPTFDGGPMFNLCHNFFLDSKRSRFGEKASLRYVFKCLFGFEIEDINDP